MIDAHHAQEATYIAEIRILIDFSKFNIGIYRLPSGIMKNDWDGLSDVE